MCSVTEIKPLVLVVADELAVRKLVARELDNAGYRWQSAATEAEMQSLLAKFVPDLVILDIDFPNENGQQLLGRLRQHLRVPIVVLSEEDREREKVAAFENGADDFLAKPFFSAELLARVAVALKHGKSHGGVDGNIQYEYGNLTINLSRKEVAVCGKEIHLTPTEYRLLSVLVRHAGSVLTPQYLLTEVWGPHHVDDRSNLQAYVAGLRRKIEPDPARPKYLLTMAGAGYKLAASKAFNRDRQDAKCKLESKSIGESNGLMRSPPQHTNGSTRNEH